MLTRLHIRYTAETFPEDLVFQETADRQNFQTRYVLRHAAKVAPDACPAARESLRRVAARKERESQALASLTGWDIGTIRARNGAGPADMDFWSSLWRGEAQADAAPPNSKSERRASV